jgi:hypothetical protein
MVGPSSLRIPTPLRFWSTWEALVGAAVDPMGILENRGKDVAEDLS